MKARRGGTTGRRRDAIELALRPFYRTEETRANIARWIARAPAADRQALASAIYSGEAAQGSSAAATPDPIARIRAALTGGRG